MDAVITYVDGLDPEWQREYSTATRQPIQEKRYRDWGLLPYLLRGIERYMPFVKNVYLVVSSMSQVPEWADRKNLHVVCHGDIIPQQFLPTFNSTTIELFLHRIEGLSERFVYFNDDFFPIAQMDETDFFDGDRAVIHFSHHLLAPGMYKKQCRASDRMARRMADCGTGVGFVRPQHTCAPMLRSVNRGVYDGLEGALAERITPLRKVYNVNQYLYSDYLYYTGRIVDRRLATKHCSMGVYTAAKIAQLIVEPRTKVICINDVAMSEAKATEMRTSLQGAFARVFPRKSRFEK